MALVRDTGLSDAYPADSSGVFSVSVPASAQVGDYIAVVVAEDDPSTTISPVEAGWTPGSVLSDGQCSGASFWREWDGASIYSFNVSTNTVAKKIYIAVIDPDGEILAGVTEASDQGLGTGVSLSILSVGAPSVLLAGYVDDTNRNVVTHPAGMTQEVFSNNGFFGIAGYSEVDPPESASTTITRTIDWGGSDDGVKGFAFLFEFSADGGTPDPAEGTGALSGGGSLAGVGHTPDVPPNEGAGVLSGGGSLSGAGEAPDVLPNAGTGAITGGGNLSGAGSTPDVPPSEGVGAITGGGQLSGIGDAPLVAPAEGTGTITGGGALSGTGHAPAPGLTAGRGAIAGGGSLAGLGDAPLVADAAGVGLVTGNGTLLGVGHVVRRGTGSVSGGGELSGRGVRVSGPDIDFPVTLYIRRGLTGTAHVRRATGSTERIRRNLSSTEVI